MPFEIEGWMITTAAVFLAFAGSIIANRVGFKKDIDRNIDRLNDHSERIKDCVEEGQCERQVVNFKEDIKEIKGLHQSLSGEFKVVSDTCVRLETKVDIAINGKKKP